MLDKIGKIAPSLAAAVLAYLAYTVVEAGALTPPQGKEGPGLTRRMLHPDLVVPKDHASPAGRDPFEVAWARYLNKMGADNPPPPKGPADEADEADEEWEAYLGETPVAPAKAAAGGAPSPPAETPKAGPPKAEPPKAAAPKTEPRRSASETTAASSRPYASASSGPASRRLARG